MVYRTEKYQKLKAEVEKQSKKREFNEISSVASRKNENTYGHLFLFIFSGEEERGTWRFFRQAAEEEDRTRGGKIEKQQSRSISRENEVDVRNRVRIYGTVEYVQ